MVILKSSLCGKDGVKMKMHNMTKNIGLKIMAFLFAVLLWVIVVNVDDPVVSAVYRDIPITVINEKYIKL